MPVITMMAAVCASSSEWCVELRRLDEVRWVQARVRRLAAALGLSRAAAWQVTIAASEAGTNMIRHGGGGRLCLRRIEQPEPGLRIEARDFGPGIDDVDRALEDHVSVGVDVRVRARSRASTGGLGTGLGAIRRLMDASGFVNLDDGGLLWAEKYVGAAAAARPAAAGPMAGSGAGRAHTHSPMRP